MIQISKSEVQLLRVNKVTDIHSTKKRHYVPEEKYILKILWQQANNVEAKKVLEDRYNWNCDNTKYKINKRV